MGDIIFSKYSTTGSSTYLASGSVTKMDRSTGALTSHPVCMCIELSQVSDINTFTVIGLSLDGTQVDLDTEQIYIEAIEAEY